MTPSTTASSNWPQTLCTTISQAETQQSAGALAPKPVQANTRILLYKWGIIGHIVEKRPNWQFLLVEVTIGHSRFHSLHGIDNGSNLG